MIVALPNNPPGGWVTKCGSAPDCEFLDQLRSEFPSIQFANAKVDDDGHSAVIVGPQWKVRGERIWYPKDLGGSFKAFSRFEINRDSDCARLVMYSHYNFLADDKHPEPRMAGFRYVWQRANTQSGGIQPLMFGDFNGIDGDFDHDNSGALSSNGLFFTQYAIRSNCDVPADVMPFYKDDNYATPDPDFRRDKGNIAWDFAINLLQVSPPDKLKQTFLTPLYYPFSPGTRTTRINIKTLDHLAVGGVFRFSQPQRCECMPVCTLPCGQDDGCNGKCPHDKARCACDGNPPKDYQHKCTACGQGFIKCDGTCSSSCEEGQSCRGNHCVPDRLNE